MIRRTVVISGLAVAVLAAQIAAKAQRDVRVYRIGWLSPTTGPRPTFREALRELGWIEGKTIAFEIRSAEGQRERLPALATELVGANVDVIVAVAPAAIRAAKQVTTKIPIVMAWWGGDDLAESKIVASFARPGGNITGVHMMLTTLDAKRLDLLHRAVPQARKIAALIHDRELFAPQLLPVREVAQKAGLELLVVNTRENDRGYDGAFEAIARAGAGALLVMGSPDFARDRKRIMELAARWRLPAIYADGARDGGLMTYGATEEELDRQVASYVDKILKGANPGDLPIEQPTRFRFVINLKTAKAIGLTMPQSLVLQADQVID